ncbi:MAG: hypothetical protein Kow0069_03440 [Promethearchaeota archaeon]
MNERPPEADPEDYDFHIAELQRIIEQAPPGYQAKFARVIASLKQRRLRRTKELRLLLESSEVNYSRLLDLLLEDLEISTNASQRFSVAMEIAQRREMAQLNREGVGGADATDEPAPRAATPPIIFDDEEEPGEHEE